MSNNNLSISLVPLALRRMTGVKTVSSGALNRQIPQAEFVDACRKYQTEAAASRQSMPKVVAGLWKSEGLATTFGKYRLPDNTLNDPRIPRESLGITHVGYGAATTEFAHFDTAKISEIIETKSEPNYQGFTHEGVGSILRIYEPGIFKLMCGILGLIPFPAKAGPDRSGFFRKFFAAFTPEQQRLIMHGYGRLIAFSKISVYKAIDESIRLPAERVEPGVQGIAFAFAMMNNEEMPRLLENSAIDYPSPIRAAFQKGLVYGIVFCEWFTPGFLAAWKPQGKLEGRLIERCREESELNLKRGYILPFQLEKEFVAVGV